MKNKLLMLLMLSTLLLITLSSVSAIIGFDNVKSYNTQTKTAIIKGSFLFIPTSTIATITLDTPSVNYVPLGYQRVAEMTFNSSQDFKTYLINKNFQLYNLRSGKGITRNLDFKVKYLVNITVPDYTYGTTGLNPNGTKIYGEVQTGSHIEQQEVWNNLSGYNFKSDQPITIGIYTNVFPGDKVEWIPNLYGQSITEWATWIQSESITEAHGVALSSHSTTAGDYIGIYITVGATPLVLVNVTLDSYAQTNGTFFVEDASNNIIYSQTNQTPKTAIFSTAPYGNVTLNASTSYVVGAWLAGNIAFHSASLPITGTYITWVKGMYSQGQYNTGELDDVVSIGIAPAHAGPSTITLNSPVDTYNTSSTDITFNWTINNVTAGTVYSTSLFIDGNISYTNSSGNNGTYIHPVSGFSEGIIHNWSAGQEDSFGTSNSSLYTFTIDTTPPQFNVTIPSYINYQVNNTNLTVNWSVSDIHLDKCWYNFNGTNITLPSCSSGTDNLVNLTITSTSNKSILFYANDSVGNINSTNASWDYIIFQNSITYNNQVIEGSHETFSLDFDLLSTLDLSNASLIYNGTAYNSTVILASGDHYTIQNSLTVPAVDSNSNLSFNFGLTLTNSSTYYTNSYNQSVLNLNIDDCSSYSNKLFTFSLVDEENQQNLTQLLNGTGNTIMEVYLNIMDSKRQLTTVNYSKSYKETNPAKICLNIPIPVDSVIPTDVQIKYYGDGYSNEYYNIFNYSLENTTANQNITLYDLNASDATEFKITLLGDNFVSVAGALIYIDRQYVAENGSYKTVEIPITDSDGHALGHFVRNDVLYNIRAVKDGQIIATKNKVTAFCEDINLGNCEIEIDTTQDSLNLFSYYNQGITFTAPEYNTNTGAVTFSFLSSDGISKTVNMNVTKNDIFGNRSICSDSLTSASGTLTCSAGNFSGSLNINISTNGELTALRTVNTDNSSYGDIGYIAWFIITLILIFVFSDSKTGILFSMSISYAGAVMLGIAKGDIIGLGAAGIWVIVITIIGIYKLNKNRQQ